MVNKEEKTRGFYTTVAEPSGILSDLVPYSKYKMFMVVANNRFESPASNTLEFTTKEGGEDAACSDLVEIELSITKKSFLSMLRGILLKMQLILNGICLNLLL